jgi:hypothetical protein
MKAARWIGVAVVAVTGLTAAVWAADPLAAEAEKTDPAPAVTGEQHAPAHSEAVYACEFHEGDCAELHDACCGTGEDTGTESVCERDRTEQVRGTKGTRESYRCGHWYRWMPGHRGRCGWNGWGRRSRSQSGGCCW